MKIETGILSAIGNTPLVVLNKLYPAISSTLYAKLEMLNPGGSTKDRTALLMLSKAIEEGELDFNSTVIESSSGNMAIGLAQVCRYLDLKLIVVTDPKINRHTVDLLQAYGAQIERVTEADSSGNYLENRLERVRELRDTIPNSYWPNQYSNDLNPEAHYHTMKEIVDDCQEPPDYLLAATSTCGTIMGCASYIQEHNLKTKVVAVDAVGSVIFGNSKGNRLIPGHGAGRKSDLLDESYIDHVFHMTDIDCVVGCRRLLQRESILAGGSAGAVVMAAEKLQSSIPENSSCVLIFSDSGERYLDTIYNDSWVKSTFDKARKRDKKESDRNGIPVSTPVMVKNTGLIDDRWPNKNGGAEDHS
ncbi:2,3-diaminopropionate biosynthesis protein SbnA [Rhodohalobacter sp. SW132]|uniref:2,3-diaminopropionate biosynthesis protein SbnA n=1 Tax=Rhodohalobacter sp. SW132 TaxID=2293433 RepID=UPI000E25A37E|nr:2,3-diaminopropionate biosynthesis protein SbnA [Rhodohalobacter sp. SW132]REL32907.1 2,3-diaminopropionate biosynthesis protein SbnA [Rhodohalobacter sp. SW132]